MEKAVRSEIRRTKINKAIIGTLATSGVLAVGVLAPNVLGALGRGGVLKIHQQKQGVKRSISRLIERGYVSVENGSARLTPKGEKFAAVLGEGKLAFKKPKRWDRKWRLLVFDIPEKRKNLRNKIRLTLTHLGFFRLQDSVWIYPYDCEDLITFLKIELRIGKDLLYIIADKVEFDLPLRKHFKLGDYQY